MLLRILTVVLVTLSSIVQADTVFKSTSDLDIYSQNKQRINNIGKWPQNTLFTAKAKSDEWLQVTGVFQQKKWLEVTQPILVAQGKSFIVVNDIVSEQQLAKTKLAKLADLEYLTHLEGINTEQWQQKAQLKRWVERIGNEQHLPPSLQEQVGQNTSYKSVRRLTDIASNASLKLNGNKSTIEFSFGTRLDRTVEFAELDLEYMYSPSLVDLQSQVKVYLNDEVVDVLRVPTKQAGKIVSRKIKLPVHQFRDFNRVKFELFGYYETFGEQCYDPNHLSIWFELLSSSKIKVNELHLPLKNDLSLLPAPFFDSNEMEKQQVNVILPKSLTTNFIQAAGTVASWLGAEAEWRGNKFEIYHNQLPEKHAIVFATNDNKPYFLSDYPDVTKPTVVMASHPFHSEFKLLLVLGQDEEQLLTAAQGLAIGHENLSGHAAQVFPAEYQKELKPYQAPLWVNNERPMKLSELVKDESELRREGVYLSPISVNLHIPADLFIWETKGVPVDLNYRYTPPNDPSQSMLNVKVNSTLVESFKLDDGDGIWEGGNRIRMPFTDQAFTMSSELLLPSFQLGIQNVMEFDFILKESSKACVNQPANKFVQVDYNSTMDFSGFEHYAEMPNLSSLAYSGLPFTRMADLSETLIVLPSAYGKEEIKVLLTMLARFSSVTGYPANKMEIVNINDTFSAEDKDIIFLNAYSEQKEEEVEFEQLNALITANKHSLSLTKDLFKDSHLSQRRFIDQAQDQPFVSIQNEFSGDMAMISEFESPFTNGRSVLSIMAAVPSSLDLVSKVFEDGTSAYEMKGAVLLLHDNKIRHSTVGEKYYTGDLPIWIMTRYHLSQRPILLLTVVFITVFLVTLLAWRGLKYLANKRLNDE